MSVYKFWFIVAEFPAGLWHRENTFITLEHLWFVERKEKSKWLRKADICFFRRETRL